MPYKRDARFGEFSPKERVELALRFYQLKLPARLDEQHVANILGIPADCVFVLRKTGLLDPLGDPSQQTPKYYATVTVLFNASDPVWLDKLTCALTEHWRKKNSRRKTTSPNGTNAGIRRGNPPSPIQTESAQCVA